MNWREVGGSDDNTTQGNKTAKLEELDTLK